MARHRRALLLLAFAVPATAPARAAQSGPAALVLQCTPRSVSGPFGTLRARNPLAEALRRCGPGSVVRLAPGRYPPLVLGVPAGRDAAVASGEPGRPIRVVGQGDVRIGGGGATDALFVAQKRPVAHVWFENVVFEAGWRSGIMFAAGGVHRGFRFVDCDVLGGWDHTHRRGRASRWGVWAHGLDDFVFEGRSRFARVAHLRDEHAFYLHNLRGDVRIEKVHCAAVGRTFVQLTARASEGPPGSGDLTIRRCVVVDTGLAPGDGFKGGSAITIAGRHRGKVLVDRCVVRFGFDARRRALTKPGEPFGTGALVATDRREREPTALLVLRDNVFEFAEGCGDRPVVQIDGVQEVRFEGRNRVVSGGESPALSLGNDPRSTPVGRLFVDPRTEVKGTILWRGARVELSALVSASRGR